MKALPLSLVVFTVLSAGVAQAGQADCEVLGWVDDSGYSGSATVDPNTGMGHVSLNPKTCTSVRWAVRGGWSAFEVEFTAVPAYGQSKTKAVSVEKNRQGAYIGRFNSDEVHVSRLCWGTMSDISRLDCRVAR